MSLNIQEVKPFVNEYNTINDNSSNKITQNINYEIKDCSEFMTFNSNKDILKSQNIYENVVNYDNPIKIDLLQNLISNEDNNHSMDQMDRNSDTSNKKELNNIDYYKKENTSFSSYNNDNKCQYRPLEDDLSNSKISKDNTKKSEEIKISYDSSLRYSRKINSISIKAKDIVYFFCCCKRKNLLMKKKILKEKAEEKFNVNLDIVTLIKKIQEIDIIKYLILDLDSLNLLNFICKPCISTTNELTNYEYEKFFCYEQSIFEYKNDNYYEIKESFENLLMKENRSRYEDRIMNLFLKFQN